MARSVICPSRLPTLGMEGGYFFQEGNHTSNIPVIYPDLLEHVSGCRLDDIIQRHLASHHNGGFS